MAIDYLAILRRLESIETKRSSIYGLTDPETGEIRYVGQSIEPEKRYRSHITVRRADDTYRARWIRSLSSPPGLIILESNVADPDGAEKRWIKKLKSEGLRLTNTTTGGQGVSDVARHLNRLCNTGRRLTPEHAAKIAKSLRGRIREPFSEEWRRKLSVAGTRRRHTEEERRKISRANKGRHRRWCSTPPSCW